MTLRRTATVVLATAIVAGLAAYLFSQREYIAASYRLGPATVLQLVALTVATLVLRAVVNRAFFRGLGVRASFGDWFALMSVSALTAYLPFASGLLAKGFFLKRVHGLSYRRFAVAQVALLLLVVATNGVAGFAAVVIFPPSRGFEATALVMLALCLAALPLALPGSAVERLPARWRPWEAQDAAAARREWPGIVVAQLAVVVAVAASLQIAFAAGDVVVSLGSCLVLAAGAVVSRVLAFTPGALGTRELVIGVLAAATGLELRDAVIASTLARGVEIAVVFSLGGFFAFRMSRAKLDQGGPSPPAARS